MLVMNPRGMPIDYMVQKYEKKPKAQNFGNNFHVFLGKYYNLPTT